MKLTLEMEISEEAEKREAALMAKDKRYDKQLKMDRHQQYLKLKKEFG